jgi:hypothetical protein
VKRVKLAVAYIAALTVSVTAFAQASASEANDQPHMRVVPIYLSDLRAMAALRIGGHPPAPVVFDTGTTGNNIDSDYASAVNLEFDPTVRLHVGDGSGKTFDAKQAKVPVATLGEVPIAEKTATVLPYKERDVVGVFGPNSFAGRELLLDLAHGRLIVRDRGARGMCRDALPYTASGLPTVMLNLPGLSLTAVADTGSNSALVLDTRLEAKLPLRAPVRSAGKGTTVVGKHDVYEGRLAGDVRIGSLVIRNPVVKFSGTDASIPYIGLPIIRKLLIMLDPERRRACIVAPQLLKVSQLADYVGRYGSRTIRTGGGRLIYRSDERGPYILRALGGDLFVDDETGDVIQFWRQNGRVVRMDFVNNIGTLTSEEKS